MIGESTQLTPQRKRVDGATVNKRFNKAIKDNGGASTVYRDAVDAETDELFDCSVNDLYQATGGKKGHRETLPQAAQEAYIVNESVAANELERQIGSLGGETQEEVNSKIGGSVRQTSNQTRKWLPW
ncbi:MAG: hypothetical protein VKK04_04475 [Synechococcales bacterium]|nr:hypothetical protein [Synechococcales bacterium]